MTSERTKHKKSRKGYVIVYTGNGKGKTTAALGLGMRAAGHGSKVVMIQFIKRSGKQGEYTTIERIPGFDIVSMGRGFTWEAKDAEENIRLANQAWEFSKKTIFGGAYDMVILDEINCVLHHGYIDCDEIIQAVRHRPAALHLVLTGRDAPPSVIESADLVTEMKEIVHPFSQGKKACPGIEF